MIAPRSERRRRPGKSGARSHADETPSLPTQGRRGWRAPAGLPVRRAAGRRIAFGLAPRGTDRVVAANGTEGIDTMTTGSVSPSRFTFAVGGLTAGACLRLPDGGQRGSGC